MVMVLGRLPEVNDLLFCFLYVQTEVVLRTPDCQVSHFLPVGSLIVVGDEAEHCGVICKFEDVVGWAGGSSVVGVESE